MTGRLRRRSEEPRRKWKGETCVCDDQKEERKGRGVEFLEASVPLAFIED